MLSDLQASGSDSPLGHLTDVSPPKIPHRLRGIPFGDSMGLVRGVKKIEIAEVRAPYNASIIEKDEGYLLFFRYDLLGKINVLNIEFPFRTHIGCVELDQTFEQKKPYVFIDTGSHFSEDPRVLKVGDELFLSYNDLAENPAYSRTIRLASLDKENLSINYSLDLDQNIQRIEKNWMPYEVVDKEGESKVFFVYNINPHKILKLNSLREQEVTPLLAPNAKSFQKLPWSDKWGILRGGTPARLIDGQYLAFFHSCFKDARTDRTFYVMGAYTFEAQAPFRITAMSRFPILFKGIYDTPHCNSARSNLHSIFPAGFVIEHVDGKDLIHISCGENDCGVKVVTLDKDILFQTLQPISEDMSKEEVEFYDGGC
ncbi:MAG: hypothetical protein ACM3JI_04665 [Anaerolineae bacterium]